MATPQDIVEKLPQRLYDRLTVEEGEIILNMGPQHPSTHGVLRFVLVVDGEVIRVAVPDVGFLHRSIEKIAELVTYPSFMPYTDRVDYLAAMNANLGWAMVVEKAAGLEVPPRVEYIRVIVCELNRIISHLVSVGSVALDLGATTPFLHALRERETVNDLIESVCGARLTYNYLTIAGVTHDLPPGFVEKTRNFLDHFEVVLEREYNKLISYNKIFIERLANVAPLSREDAIRWGIVGPNLRASGVKWDLRRDEPYSVYPELEFDVPVGTGEKGTVGDCYDRYMLRIREMVESCKIVRQCLERIPEGEIQGKTPRTIKPPAGMVYVRTEAPRGEMGYFLISDGSNKPVRCKIRTGSFSAMSVIEHMSPGLMIADMVALIATLDVIAPEVDR